MKKKLIRVMSLLLALAVICVPFGIWKALADAPPPYVTRILEISDNGTSYALKELLKQNSNVVVDTVRMKKFVAMRDDLDGKYDAIYFGEGKYNPAMFATNYATNNSAEQQKAHDTTEFLNDITDYKANQIKQLYISKGLPVIFHSSIAKQNPNGKLFSLYNTYANASSRLSNIIVVGTEEGSTTLDELVSRIKNEDSLFRQRPQVKLTGSGNPQDFLKTPSVSYTTGNVLTFTFDANYVKNFAQPVNAKLYMSVDKSLPFGESNVVASSTLNQRESNRLSYTVPKTFSGPVYWKLEVNANGQKDYASGAIRIKDQTTNIKVLQVLPNSSTSSLNGTSSNIMNSSYLKNAEKGYNITIQTVNFSDFQNKDSEYSYSKINGKFDMLIFGFADSYNTVTNADLDTATANAIKDFINTGQAVMFTHDTIYMSGGNKANNWTRNFQTITGQTENKTNLGLSAPYVSSQVKSVNSGMLTDFPFDLNAAPSLGRIGDVAPTHDQYFMLDLGKYNNNNSLANDPLVVSWYNIVSDPSNQYKRDIDDSYNHYYTYSKGNVTYSGSGHTNNKFPEWEQKLFVNTMFRAFMGANHAPEITVITPENNATRPSYLENLVFSYQVDDLDLKDLTAKASVKFKVNGQDVTTPSIAAKTVTKGQVVTESVAMPAALANGGKLQIEITAKDAQGAAAVKTIDLTIVKQNVSIEAKRSLSVPVPEGNKYPLGESVSMNYEVTPKSIPASDIRSGEKGLATLEVSKVKYQETLDPDLILTDADKAFLTKGGIKFAYDSTAKSYTLTKELGTETYTLNTTTNSYEPKNAVKTAFVVKATPKVKKTYILNNAVLTYEDLHAVAGSATNDTDTAAQSIKDYSLIVLGNQLTDMQSFSTSGRAAVGGALNVQGFTIAQDMQNKATRNSPISLTVNGNLNIGSGGGTVFGPLLVGENLTWPSWINLDIMKKVSIAGIADLQGLNGDATQLTYGKSYTGQAKVPAPIKGDYQTIRNEVQAAFNFTTASASFEKLSDYYASLSSTGQKANDGYGHITLKGSNAAMNVFNFTEQEINNNNQNLEISLKVPSGSTTVINVDSSTRTRLYAKMLANGSELNADSADSLRKQYPIVWNFSKPTSLDLSYTAGTVLAPKAKAIISSNGGNLKGTLIVKELQGTNSNFFLGMSGLPGTVPVPPATTPTPGEIRSIPFLPEVVFTAVQRVTGIYLDSQSIWVGSSLKLTPKVEPEDASNQILKWSISPDSDPSIISISADGTITGLKAGATKVRVEATDGSGVSTTADITVEEPVLFIKGPSKINVGSIFEGIQVLTSGNNLALSDIKWSVVTAKNGGAASVEGSESNRTVDLKGLTAGTVTLRVEATVNKLNSKGDIIERKPKSAEIQIDIVSPLNSLTLNGPDWIPAYKAGSLTDPAVRLTAVADPLDANLKSVEWTITNASTLGTLASSSTGTTLNNVLNSKDQRNVKPDQVETGKIVVKATATATGTNPTVATGEKTIRVIDVEVTSSQDRVYLDDKDPLTLGFKFNTADLPTWTNRPIDYSWKLENLKQDSNGNWVVDSASTLPYAQLSNTNTASPTLSPANGLEGKVRVTLTVGGMTSFKDIDVQARLTGLQLPPEIPIRVGQTIDLNLLLNPTPGVMVNRLSEILPVLQWHSAITDSATVTNNLVPPGNTVTGGLVTGVKAGTFTIVTVTYPGSQPITTTTKIVVISGSTPVNPTDPTDPVDPTNPEGPTGNNLY